MFGGVIKIAHGKMAKSFGFDLNALFFTFLTQLVKIFNHEKDMLFSVFPFPYRRVKLDGREF